MAVVHHTWEDYARSATALIKQQKLDQALEQMKLGLKKFPRQFELLLSLTDFYSSLNENSKSLRCAKLLEIIHPSRWEGYGRRIHKEIELNQINDAKSIAEKGILLTKNPVFLVILSNIAFTQGEDNSYEKYERILADKLSHGDIYDKFNITPKFFESKLKVEHVSGVKENNNSSIHKPDLYIVAGFSGCGKSTFLDSARFSVDKIFSQDEVTVKMLPPEISKFLQLRHSFWDNRDQSMLFSDAFTDIEYLHLQEILPKQTLLHLNLTNLLFKGYPNHFRLHGLEESDLKSPRLVSSHFRRFFEHEFFKKFATISIATISINFELNAIRYTSRTGNKFHFKAEMKDTYNQILQIWHREVSSLATNADNIITESDFHYVVRPKKLFLREGN